MDAFVLVPSLSELRRELTGAAVFKVSQPSLSSLLVQFLGPSGTVHLLLSADPSSARLHLVMTPPPLIPLTPFGGLVERYLKGRTLQRIEQEGLERVVAFFFQDVTLYAEIMGKNSNLILTDGSRRVLRALRRRPGLGETYTPPPKPKKRDPFSVNFEEFQRLLYPTPNTQPLTPSKEPWKVLVDTFFGLSPLIAKEVALRVTQHPSPHPPPQRGEGGIEGLWQALQEVLAIVREARFEPRLLLDEKGYPFALAAFPFRSFPEDRQIPYAKMSEAAERFYPGKMAEEELVTLKRRVVKQLASFEKRLLRRKVKLEETLLRYEKAETYQTMGRLLLAHKGHIQKGERVVGLPDYTGGIVTIPLDPALSLHANAERFFRLYKKAKKGEAIARKRLNEAEAELHRLTLLRKRFEEASDREAISTLERELLIRAPSPSELKGSKTSKALESGVRRFRSSDGFEILVGKSGRRNEDLTWKLAKPHDLWLHVHGVSGSHVLVRLPPPPPPSPFRGRKGVPPKTLEEAAKLAAYYSKGRNQGKVEVAYTLRKHLKKPKKGKVGAVLLMHEKTILVEPDPALIKKLVQP